MLLVIELSPISKMVTTQLSVHIEPVIVERVIVVFVMMDVSQKYSSSVELSFEPVRRAELLKSTIPCRLKDWYKKSFQISIKLFSTPISPLLQNSSFSSL